MIENIIVVTFLLVLCVAIDVIILILAKVLTMKKPSTAKIQRFESGNPPIATPKFVLPMQYVGFLLMFLGCEPILVLFLLLSLKPLEFVHLLVIGLILLIPAIYASYKCAYDIAYVLPRRELRYGR